ncbi:NAD-glutamate dehydrogenase [Psychromonas sp. PT13]|uniref:NAD-glutamate dehydrogenase n=1 Tax=Psychromonas sp. PT13 TaxID=3439547 RepID=UPI003EB91419
MVSTLNQKSDILEQIFSQLKNDVSDRAQKSLQQFISIAYRNVAVGDLTSMTPADLVGLTVCLWREVQQWKSIQAKVEVFNPDVEQDEWQSPHTLISVVCRNTPFVIDTLQLIINAQNIKIHRIFYSEMSIERTKAGKLSSFDANSADELLLYFEIDKTTSKVDCEEIKIKIQQALENVSLVVDDYLPITKKLKDGVKYSKSDKFNQHISDLAAQQGYLTWLLDSNFIFIGCEQFTIENNQIKTVENSRLGLLKQPDFITPEWQFEDIAVLQETSLIHFSKSYKRAMVHRLAHPDVVYVKRFNEKGELVSGFRFIGLYTAAVYGGSPANVPIVADKLTNVLAQSGYSHDSHYYKELAQILYTYPLEDLLLCDEQTLLNDVIEVLYAQERKNLKLFLRNEANKQFVIASLYVPRDVYNTRVRLSFEELICRTLDVNDRDFQVFLSESNLARLRIVFRLQQSAENKLEVQAIEARMNQLIRRWDDDLQASLVDHCGEEKGNQLSKKYCSAFPINYQDTFSARVAVADIERIECLYAKTEHSMALHFYRSNEVNNSELKLKLFHQDGALLLSDIIPILENMGLKVAEEYPYKIALSGKSIFWLYDFTLLYGNMNNIDPNDYRERFSDAFLSIWYGCAANDSFNKLILGAGLAWRDISMLRAYAKYLKQLRFGFGEKGIANTLLNHSELTQDIVALFKLRFDPKQDQNVSKQEKLQESILETLNQVTNLNEDRVLRKYIELIMATQRSNYFQQVDGKNKPFISFKVAHDKITEMPLPRLMYEIFVYSPRLEGTHLRGGKVARGGLRWSDRGEDFRTEILGLVKAQQVKNAVIVPVGAKGGFVAKNIVPTMDREAMMKEGISCYKIFISALLDITDNLSHGKIVPPVDVVRYDGDDPYFVVAADKGTATFSDIANELAIQRDFWLNDAFASGGGNGYDHKKMGITARGAWMSVQRHFRELAIDVQKQSFTVVGIGDMAGDVFGNGMLRSEHIVLVGAFNHRHIFIDPTPLDLHANYQERLRLFETPRTGWDDYDKSLISKGGGVFDRALKSITVTPEMAQRFDIVDKKVTPNELISLLLKAKVDLLWNGGIGTYVKASTETDADAGDKSNDSVRINANALRCSVIGEGGNLGFTQRSRIEFSQNNGLCFTDALDNAAGVNCSDLEVNIKILLDKLVAKGDLTVKQRNQWLGKMTDQVGDLVLKNNYRQAQSVSNSFIESYQRIEEYRRLINTLESKGKLNRALEFVPTDEQLSKRKNYEKGLSRPTISVLLSYAKIELKQALVDANVTEDPYLLGEANKIFPSMLVKSYKSEIEAHSLINEIVATQISNDLFNIMGTTFAHQIMDSSGCSFLELSQAWVAARDIFELDDILEQIESLDNQVDYQIQSDLVFKLQSTIANATRWLIRNHREDLSAGGLITKYQGAVQVFVKNIETILVGKVFDYRDKRIHSLTDANVPQVTADRVTSIDAIYSLLGIISVAHKLDVDTQVAAKVHFLVADKLKLFKTSQQLNMLPVDTHWQSLAKESMFDDLEWQHKRITQVVLQTMNGDDINQAYADWEAQHFSLVERWVRMADSLSAVVSPEFSMCQVALRELLDLSSS